jgi:hypothetical protein
MNDETEPEGDAEADVIWAEPVSFLPELLRKPNPFGVILLNRLPQLFFCGVLGEISLSPMITMLRGLDDYGFRICRRVCRYLLPAAKWPFI